MKRVFCSGSCRLLTTITHGYGKIEPIHSMFRNFVGINFLGKIHNIKQHIQFIKWIKGAIDLPPHILAAFLTSYGLYSNSRIYMEPLELNPIKKKNIQDLFDDCDVYIFEVCSLKLHEKEGYQVQYELTNDYTTHIQTDNDLYNDLNIIRELIPKEKKIIFQTHFRPNVIYNNQSMLIDKREIIYNTVERFCNTNNNVFLYDPSILLHSDISLFDGDTHFTTKGHETSFNYLYENFIK